MPKVFFTKTSKLTELKKEDDNKSLETRFVHTVVVKNETDL